MREKIIFCKPGGGAREEAGEGHPRRCKSTSAYGAISLARGKQDFSSCRKRRGGGRRNRVIDRAALQSDFYRLRGPVCTRESNRPPLRKRAHGASMTRRFSH